MRSSSPGRTADVVVAVTLFALAAITFLRAAETVPFHGDESEWINAGRYFKYLFLDRSISGQVWEPSFLTRDQPPLGRYVIGGIVWAAGNDLANVNRSYDWKKDYATNERENRVPGPRLRQPVRQAMAILGALSIVGLYVAGRLLAGPVAGAVAAGLVTLSPLVQLYFAQARTEALLAVFSVLGLVGLLVVARRFRADGSIPTVGWLAGLALGLALATKLTAALAIVGVGAYSVAALLNRWQQDAREATLIGVWGVVTGALAALVFVGVNPFLWADPYGRTYSMLEQQRTIMLEQGVQFGGAASPEPLSRLSLVVGRTFVENATPSFDEGRPAGGAPVLRRSFFDLPAPLGISLELALALAGFGVLVWRARSSWAGHGRPGVETALLCWLIAYFGGIAINLSLDWPRYYVPTAFFGSLLIGLAVSAVWRTATAGFANRAPAPPARQSRIRERLRS